MYEQRLQQQKMQQQQQQQQHQQQHSPQVTHLTPGKKIKRSEPENFEDLTIKSVLQKSKNTIVVFFMIMFFNLSPIDDFLRFKKVSFFYDANTHQSTFAFTFFKAILLSVLYYTITLLIQ